MCVVGGLCCTPKDVGLDSRTPPAGGPFPTSSAPGRQRSRPCWWEGRKEEKPRHPKQESQPGSSKSTRREQRAEAQPAGLSAHLLPGWQAARRSGGTPAPSSSGSFSARPAPFLGCWGDLARAAQHQSSPPPPWRVGEEHFPALTHAHPLPQDTCGCQPSSQSNQRLHAQPQMTLGTGSLRKRVPA